MNVGKRYTLGKGKRDTAPVLHVTLEKKGMAF
jgi:hypothetical protein